MYKYIHIYFFIQKKVFILYKQLKTIDMAIQIKSYWKTNDIGDDQLKLALESAKNQDYKIYKLFQTYGLLTHWDVYDLYNEFLEPIQPSSVGRSINSLKRNNVIVEAGTIPGPMNRPVTLYSITNNPPDVLKSFNKSIPLSVSVDVILNDDGLIDVDKMYDDLAEKIVFLTNKFKL